MNRFVKDVASVLEVEDIGLNDDFREVPGWCSLQGFGLLVLMENDWKAPIGIETFLNMRTVKDLYREEFLSFAARQLGVERSQIGPETAYGTLEKWDSVGHLKLVMEAESYFGTSYAMERIPEMKKLEDFLEG